MAPKKTIKVGPQASPPPANAGGSAGAKSAPNPANPRKAPSLTGKG